MARLRKPSPLESSIFLQEPTQTQPTLSSPRKAVREVSYIISSDEDEENIPLRPKPSKRDLGDPSSIFQDDSFYTSRSHASPSTLTLTPRRQRILRPVESNSRLLRKLSDESLASPEKRPGSERRARRERNGTHEVDIDIRRKRNLMYAKSLARSVAGRELKKASSRIDVLDDTELRSPGKVRREKKEVTIEVEEVEPEPEHETSILCGDEEDVAQEVEEQQVETNKIEQPTSEEQDEEDDDDIVLPVRSGNRRPQRRVDSDSESEYEEAAAEEEQEPEEEQSEEPQPLVSTRSPHRNGHSTISNWAQEVIDLTDSPEAPDPFVLPESTRARSSSFAVSRPTTSSLDGLQPFLT